MMETVLLIGVVTGFNFLVILYKINQKRYENAALDAAIMVAAGVMFAGTVSGMAAAMISSFVVSIALFFIRVPTLADL